MKRLEMKDVVALARKKGISVTVRIRKDGSVRVKEIDGKKYKGDESKGNTALRQLMDKPLSRAQRRQRKVASPTFGFSKAEIKAVKALRKIEKKNNMPKMKPISFGRAKNSRRFYGADYLRSVKTSILHHLGFAYPEEVRQFGQALYDATKELGYNPDDFEGLKILREGNLLLLDATLRQFQIETNSANKKMITLEFLNTLADRLKLANIAARQQWKAYKESGEIAKGITLKYLGKM